MAGWLILGVPPLSTTIFSATLNADDNGNGGFSLRSRCLTTAGPGVGGKVRVTIKSSATQALSVDHVGIGVWDGAANANTTATPTEVTFTTNGPGAPAHGFSIPANTTLVSDWITFSYSNGNSLIVICDTTTGANGGYRVTAASGGTFINAASYNVASPAGQNANSNLEGVSLIETQ